MILDIVRVFQRVPTVVFAAPLIFLLPVLAEGLQHFVEFQIGMFASADSMAAAGASQQRLIFGVIKIISLLYVMLWVSRFWFQGAGSVSLLFGRQEFVSLLTLLGFTAAVMAFVIVAGPPLVEFVAASPLPVPENVLPFVPLLVLLLLTFPLQHLSVYWFGRFLGDDTMTVKRARRAVKGQMNRMTLIFVVPIAPFMVLHYWLNYQGVGLEPQALAIVLTADSILVGLMAIIMGNAVWATWEHAVHGTEASSMT